MLNGMLPLPVQNETCTGTRRLPMPPEGLSLPDFSRLVRGSASLADSLHAHARRRRAPAALRGPELCRGILYHTVKFCDFYEFEFAKAAKRNKAAAFKTRNRRHARRGRASCALRVEAFAESLPQTKRRATPSPSLPKTKDKQFFAGIDSGSTSTNVVILDAQQKIVGSAIVPTGAQSGGKREKGVGNSTCPRASDAGRPFADRHDRLRARLPWDPPAMKSRKLRAMRAGHGIWDPHVRTILDIGGQDSKAIRLDEAGHVQSFVMNDKCAAGTGRFSRNDGPHARPFPRRTEHTRAALERRFDHHQHVHRIRGKRSGLPRRTKQAHGGHPAWALQSRRQQSGLPVNCVWTRKLPFLMTGGVASNAGVVRAVEEKLGAPLEVFPEHQLCGALGAALLAMEG